MVSEVDVKIERRRKRKKTVLLFRWTPLLQARRSQLTIWPQTLVALASACHLRGVQSAAMLERMPVSPRRRAADGKQTTPVPRLAAAY